MQKGRLLSIAVAALLSMGHITAQEYLHEVGAAVGTSFYLGDTNATQLYQQVKPAFGAIYRHNINYRWAIKGQLLTGGISGDTKLNDNRYPNGANYSFDNQLFDLGVQAEFNFFNYGMGMSYLGTSRIAPYLSFGLGLVTTGDVWSANIPIGVGLKYKIAPRWNVGIDFSLRKSFTDRLDSNELDDPYVIESSWLKNTDWYSFTLLTVSYDLGKIKENCNNL